ncbi:fatty acid/sphingolipid desaturase [Patellaria atrata CBS 101060]|uniref:Delta 8-(E)-sphingolipid desaturase n=1 Tax=Patellaria atrata CBS 101060 TaxID=1346257 RepID=A0A9P4VP66_9PEZI|nr:fatty acid/sphingolipid desaturase [Patellaria atrata CBS 101060]
MTRNNSPSSRRNIVLDRRRIEGLISEGRSIIIVDDKVLKVDAWLNYHPGGDKAIRHMVGRDATDEVNALHSQEARQQMLSYQIGRIEGPWLNFIPPIQGGKFRPMRSDEEDEEEDCEVSQAEDTLSTGSNSRVPSPIFEPADTSPLSYRKGSRRLGTRSSSMTSMSSVELEKTPKMSHMDILTQKAIDLDRAKYPPLDPQTQADIVRKYRLLNEKIKAEDLYRCRYISYFIEACRYSLLFVGFLFLLHWKWYTLSAVCIGLFWHQISFTVHDAGHMGITHDFTTDTVIGVLLADFMGGLSIGWWKRSHNVHHIVTNSPEHDPDIEHIPFFAVSHRFFSNLYSTYHDKVMSYDRFAQFFIAYQNYLYYIILLFGRFNLYVQSWLFLSLGLGPRKGPAAWHRWFELSGHACFWFWFGYGVMYKSIDTNWHRFVFLMVSHMITAPLHLQITLSHFAMSTADNGPHESFPQKMLRTTMDVDCPQWLDFVHGGLQFQAIHHLFPRIPRHNLRRAQKLVQEFCTDVGIPYALYGFVDGNKEVIGHLGEVRRQMAILAECQRTIAEGGFGLGH